MKTASKILIIIGSIIGILWSIIGFFSVWFGGAVAITLDKNIKTEDVTDIMLKMIGSFIVIIIGLILGIIAANKKTKKITTIILGILLLSSGILATVWHSYATGPIYILSSLLLILAGIFQKTKKY